MKLCITKLTPAIVLALGLVLGSACHRCEAAYSDVVLADNPIAYWKLDETSGSTAVNDGSLGSAANGSFVSAHTKEATSLVAGPGTSVLFSGGSVSFGNINDINRAGPFTQKTIELWFRPHSLSGRQVLYEQGGGTRGLNIYLDGGDLYLAGWNQANDDGGGGAAPWGTPSPVFVSLLGAVATNTTYHVVLVMDGDASGTSGAITGYLNGVSIGQQVGVGRLWNHNPAVIGDAVAGTRFHDNNTSTTNRDFDGQIDEVALYNTALSAAQVLLHFQEGNQSAGLVGHWKFDEGFGTTAADSTSTGNDVTLQSGASWATDCLNRNIIEFDGFSGDAVTGSPFSPPSTGTIAFWMRSSGNPTSRERIFGLGGDWETRQEPDGTLSFDLGAEGPPEFVTNASLDKEDRWYHVVAVFDANDDTYEVWVDGQLDNSGTNSSDMTSQSPGLLSFGTRTGSSENWEGALRDFRVYSTKLSPAEIAELYGIIAHWAFDESTGTDAADSSGRGNDAEYIASPTLGAAGAFPPKTDKSVQLDGFSEYVTANQGLLNDVEEFTLAGWFKSSDLAPVKSFFGQYELVEVGIDMSARQLELWTDAGGSLTAPNVMVLGKWQHVAAVGTRTSLTLYVNGHEVASGGTGASNYGNNSEVFKVGEGVMESSSGYFDGRVDEVRVYSRALCPDQIYELYKGARPSGVRIIKWIEVR